MAPQSSRHVTEPDGLVGPRQLYQRMLLIRRFDEAALEARLRGAVFGTMHPYVGQEAVAVGVCSALAKDDRIVSNHRGHGHCIAKGADPARMMAELFGRATGYCHGKGGSMHIADFSLGILGANGIVGAGMPIAAGSALATILQGRDEVTVAFFGDGAAGQGVFHEALNLASVWKLPAIWVCENNQYADQTRLDEAMATVDIHRFAEAHGFPAIPVDGNDVVAVARAAREAVARARSGDGPTFIEAKTFRQGVHAQRGVRQTESRPLSEVSEWGARDPILRFERTLVAGGLLGQPELDEVSEQVDAVVREALAFAESSPFPAPDDALRDLWAEPSEVEDGATESTS